MEKVSNYRNLQNGKYLLLDILGQGGYGITYLGEQVLLQRKVAIKQFFIKDICAYDSTRNCIQCVESATETFEYNKHRFLKEARLIASLDSPHIVKIIDVFEENGTAYYVMEYIDGVSLKDKCENHPLSELETIKYVHQIGEALAYIHERNILHLDVKPANIMIRDNGTAILIDFGISKGYDNSGDQTTSSVLGLSKGYASLEQYTQDLKHFSPATDIYSFGATVYTMLTGKLPPEAITVAQEGMPNRPPHISNTIWTAITSAMLTHKEKRPQSVASFMSLLNSETCEQLERDSLDTIVLDKKKTRQTEKVEKNGNKRIGIIVTLAVCLISIVSIVCFMNYDKIRSNVVSKSDTILVKDIYNEIDDSKGNIQYVPAYEYVNHNDEFVKKYAGYTINMVDREGKHWDVPINKTKLAEKNGFHVCNIERQEVLISKNVYQLYDALKQDGYDLQKFSSKPAFREYLKEKDHARDLYNDLLQIGFTQDDIGSEEEFLTFFGVK